MWRPLMRLLGLGGRGRRAGISGWIEMRWDRLGERKTRAAEGGHWANGLRKLHLDEVPLIDRNGPASTSPTPHDFFCLPLPLGFGDMAYLASVAVLCVCAARLSGGC
jgi:hypothetical protein